MRNDGRWKTARGQTGERQRGEYRQRVGRFTRSRRSGETNDRGRVAVTNFGEFQSSWTTVSVGRGVAEYLRPPPKRMPICWEARSPELR